MKNLMPFENARRPMPGFLVGLGLIFLVVIGQWLLERSFEQSNREGALEINAAGRQRMLTWQTHSLISGGLIAQGNEWAQTAGKIRICLSLLLRAQVALETRNYRSLKSAAGEDAVCKHGDGRLTALDVEPLEKPVLAGFLRNAWKLASAQQPDAALARRLLIEIETEIILVFDTQTAEFQLLSETDRAQRQNYRQLALLATLIVIVSSSLMVFWPMARKIRTAVSALEGANADLLTSRSRFEDVARASAHRFWETDQNHRFTWMMDDIHSFGSTSPEESLGKTRWETTNVDPNDEVWRSHREDLAARRPFRDFRFKVRDDDGQTKIWRSSGIPVFDENGEFKGYRGSGSDISELAALEDHHARTRRLQSLGQLTAGIAHDFNNILTVIQGNIEFVLSEDGDWDRNELLAEVYRASESGADLTRLLLAYGRRSSLNAEQTDLNDAIKQFGQLAERTLPATIQIEIVGNGGLWKPLVDRPLLESALLNLVLNARDAMPDGGKLIIETANIRLDDDYMDERHEDVPPGRYVLLAITDTGEGIPQDVIDQVFEPYFTTKPVGSGSGLGLSMVHGFVKQSNAVIRIYSEPGEGTTVKIYFPIAAVVQTAPKPDEQHEIIAHQEHNILLVEDDENVARVLQRQLTSLGCKVTLVNSADYAVDLIRNGLEFDVLVTDIVMPGVLQGPGLVKLLRDEYDDLKVIFVSGYPSEAAIYGNGLRPNDITLMKPVQRRQLAGALQRVRQGG